MSVDALNIYSSQLAEIIGENGNFTEPAVYDPSGSALDIYGIFDNVTFRSDKDGGNVYKKSSSAVFVVYDVPIFDIYSNMQLTITDRSKTYKIEYVDTDINGVQTLWLS